MVVMRVVMMVCLIWLTWQRYLNLIPLRAASASVAHLLFFLVYQ
jgi:hypothetical protein